MDGWVCGTPFVQQAAEKEWKRLVREAIRAKGGNIRSIAPSELRKLVIEYLAEHPERNEQNL